MDKVKNSFGSNFGIDAEVTFLPLFKDIQEYSISGKPINTEYLEGTIVAVKFTKAKVFYDCLSDYFGTVFKDIPSDFVKCVPKIQLEE